jgi:hypothetical protein
MSPRPSKVSAPGKSRITRESTPEATERQTRRKIGFDETGHNVRAGALRGNHQMNAGCARHLR